MKQVKPFFFFIGLAVVFHLVYALSIFDIYFRTPLVHGMKPHQLDCELHSILENNHPSTDASKAKPCEPADRLVLFVGDGLRADKFFQVNSAGHSRAPFLHDLIKYHGAQYGISHTRVPTESRPGHVALIAGFYEDVSAVTRGWKTNPVEFDSTFNQSQHTWSFGSPDVLPMFAVDVPHVETIMYEEDFYDFAKDSRNLDRWVFEKVKEMLNTQNETLIKSMKRKKVIFFLHLLGIDTAGHSHRPYSPAYLDNILYIDTQIKDIVLEFEKFFEFDGRTAFIFTADHGMSNKGTHGDGEIANTETPLVVWGAGTTGEAEWLEKEKQMKKTYLENDVLEFKVASGEYLSSETDSIPVDLSQGAYDFIPFSEFGKTPQEVNQADIAPLIASLIGIPIPVNNVGRLPTEYLIDNPSIRIQSLFVNAKQIMSQVNTKSEMKRKTTVGFKPCPGTEKLENFEIRVENFLKMGLIQEAEELSNSVLDFSLHCLHYYQTYDWLFLMTTITFGYLSFIVYTLIEVSKNFDNSYPPDETTLYTLNIASFITFALLAVYLFLNASPVQYYIYVCFPVYFTNRILFEYKFISTLSEAVNKKNCISLVLYFLVLESMVFGYYQREIFGIAMCTIGLWYFNLKNSRVKYIWFVSCCITACFLRIPIDSGKITYLIPIGSVMMILVGLGIRKSFQINAISIGYSIIASVLVISTEHSLFHHHQLPFLNQFLSWLILGSSLFFISGKNSQDRLINIMYAILPCITLLSVSFELLFYVSFCWVLFQWFTIESKQIQPDFHRDLRNCLFYIAFCYISFFGVGNIASVSSFEIASAFRFITIFDPFIMGGLLITKIILLFIPPLSTFSLLNQMLGVEDHRVLFLVVIFSDVMSLNFFFQVRDEGSWREIGESISHFAISNAFILIQLGLFSVSRLITRNISLPGRKSQEKEK